MGLIPNFEFDEINSHYQMWYGDEYIGSFSNVCFTKTYFRGEKWCVQVPDKSYFLVEYQGKRWFFDISKEKTSPQLMTDKWFNWFLYTRDHKEFWFFIVAMFSLITWFVWLDPFNFSVYGCMIKEFVKFLFSCDFPGHLYRPEYKKCFY